MATTNVLSADQPESSISPIQTPPISTSTASVSPPPTRATSIVPSALDLKPHIAQGTFAALLTGSSLGVILGSRTSALRFRAENAHRLPRSQKGWYMYHKAKNYYVLQHSFTSGATTGLKISSIVLLFLVAEEAIAREREMFALHVATARNDPTLYGNGEKNWLVGRDFRNAMVAATGASGVYALFARMGMGTGASLIRNGLVGGMVFGLAQDALRLAQGYKLTWVENLKGVVRGGD